jgi:hypothetical protein
MGLLSGKCSRTKLSLTTATIGEFSLSCAAKSRPPSSGIFIV